MNNPLLTCDWTASIVHLPSYGFLLLAIPLVGLLAIKFGGLANSGSPKKGQSWIPSGEVDENGLPLMTREKSASQDARMRAAMAAYEPRSRR